MRIQSPYDPAHFIEFPNEWLGKHAKRHDEAVAASQDMPATWREFACAMALLDDWNLPGLPKNPEKWDFGAMSLRVMAWVKNEVLLSYYRCFQVPKNSSPLSSPHSTIAAESEAAGSGVATL
jgi:hypothetical protein